MNILHLVPYWKLYPAYAGGALRCLHLNKQMARFGKVDLVTLQSADQIQTHGNVTKFSLTDYELERLRSKSMIHRLTQSIRFKLLTRQYSRPADMNVLVLSAAIRCIPENQSYDIVVFEHLQSMLLATQLRKRYPNARFILDAHNVDHLLLQQEHQRIPIQGFAKEFKWLREIESNLLKYVSEVWACSEDDAVQFRAINSSGLQVKIVANGVDASSKLPVMAADAEPFSILFCGDLNTVANRSGLLWFFECCWPTLSETCKGAVLNIAGKGHEQICFAQYHHRSDIKFHGMVPDLKSLYARSSVTIAPLTVGSGTRLKILEALSYGVPMVATRKAAEGVPYESGKHLLLADDPGDFTKAVCDLMNNRSLNNELRIHGRAFVEQHFDWNVIGNKIKASLTEHGYAHS